MEDRDGFRESSEFSTPASFKTDSLFYIAGCFLGFGSWFRASSFRVAVLGFVHDVKSKIPRYSIYRPCCSHVGSIRSEVSFLQLRGVCFQMVEETFVYCFLTKD